MVGQGEARVGLEGERRCGARPGQGGREGQDEAQAGHGGLQVGCDGSP